MREPFKTILIAVCFMGTIICVNACGHKQKVDLANPVTETDTTGKSDPAHMAADSLAKEGVSGE